MSESLFTTQTPTNGNESDGGSGLTQAHVMYATVDGTISGIRWYSPVTAPPNTPTVELWTPTSTNMGTKLASKLYEGSHVGGTWQQQLFDTPVTVLASTYFVPAVCQDTRYVFRASTFTASITNGHLVGIQDGTDPLGAGYTIGNGRLKFGGPNFYPDYSPGGGPGFLVDVLFDALVAPTGPDLDLTYGQPTTAWSTGEPRLSWSVDAPRSSWTMGRPR